MELAHERLNTIDNSTIYKEIHKGSYVGITVWQDIQDQKTN